MLRVLPERDIIRIMLRERRKFLGPALVVAIALWGCSHDTVSPDSGQPDSGSVDLTPGLDAATDAEQQDAPPADLPVPDQPQPDTVQADLPGADTASKPDGVKVDGPTACVQEGAPFTDFNPQGKCCGTLVPLLAKVPNGQPGGCSTPKCPCYVCTQCGDGLCGKGENGCNCPQDCGKACFGENEAFQNWGADLSIRCCTGLTPVSDCIPAGTGCACPSCPCYRCTFCGDSQCGPGENWCNCLTDCPQP